MTEKRTVPKKILQITKGEETSSSVITNKIGQIIGWAVRGFDAPTEGGDIVGLLPKPKTTKPSATNGIQSHDANLDY